jgi:hypothetical protein
MTRIPTNLALRNETRRRWCGLITAVWTSHYFPRDRCQRNSFLEMPMRPSCSSEVRGRAGDRWRRQGKARQASHRLVKQRPRSSQEQKRPLCRRNGQTKCVEPATGCLKRVCEVRATPSIFTNLLIARFISCEDSQRQRLVSPLLKHSANACSLFVCASRVVCGQSVPVARDRAGSGDGEVRLPSCNDQSC